MSYDRYIYEKAEAELSKRRYNAETEQELRIKEIEEKIPEIREINIQLSQTVVELSKLIISRSPDFEKAFDKIKENNLHAQKMVNQLLTSNGYPEDYLETHYRCEKCNDKGYIEGQKCDCFLRLLNKYAVEKLNETANMPDCDFEHFSLDFYEGKIINGMDCREKMTSIYNYCVDYAKRFTPASDSLFLYGKTGVGKTHLSLSIAKAVAGKGFTVAYGSIINYLNIIEKEHFGRAESSESDTMSLLINTELLVLDDLGSEFSTSFYESVIYNIINSRINMGLPTIINTNLSTEELQKKYNDRIISRIFGMYTTLWLTGEDIRQIKRLKNKN